MNTIIPEVAEAMQKVLTQVADRAAHETGFIKRLRKINGANFVQTLVFGWLSKPDATLEDLAQTAAGIGLVISPQGLDERFTLEAANLMKQVLEESVQEMIAANPVAIPILERFNGVYIQDIDPDVENLKSGDATKIEVLGFATKVPLSPF